MNSKVKIIKQCLSIISCNMRVSSVFSDVNSRFKTNRRNCFLVKCTIELWDLFLQDISVAEITNIWVLWHLLNTIAHILLLA